MNANRETAFLYAKGSSMLTKYLEMNGLRAVSVDRSSVWIEDGNGIGFHTEHRSNREAKVHARKLADHTGLPILN